MPYSLFERYVFNSYLTEFFSSEIFGWYNLSPGIDHGKRRGKGRNIFLVAQITGSSSVAFWLFWLSILNLKTSLKFRLLGSVEDIGCWGHGYVRSIVNEIQIQITEPGIITMAWFFFRNLVGEISHEFQNRQVCVF